LTGSYINRTDFELRFRAEDAPPVRTTLRTKPRWQIWKIEMFWQRTVEYLATRVKAEIYGWCGAAIHQYRRHLETINLAVRIHVPVNSILVVRENERALNGFAIFRNPTVYTPEQETEHRQYSGKHDHPKFIRTTYDTTPELFYESHQ